MFFLKAEVFYGGINVVSSWAKWQARKTEKYTDSACFSFSVFIRFRRSKTGI